MSKVEDSLLITLRELRNENRELKDTLKRSIEISIKILRSESVRNFDEFVSYTEHLINKEGTIK